MGFYPWHVASKRSKFCRFMALQNWFRWPCVVEDNFKRLPETPMDNVFCMGRMVHLAIPFLDIDASVHIAWV
jgi:hypothetical protein